MQDLAAERSEINDQINTLCIDLHLYRAITDDHLRVEQSQAARHDAVGEAVLQVHDGHLVHGPARDGRPQEEILEQEQSERDDPQNVQQAASKVLFFVRPVRHLANVAPGGDQGEQWLCRSCG
jgi:hypothetical protein